MLRHAALGLAALAASGLASPLDLYKSLLEPRAGINGTLELRSVSPGEGTDNGYFYSFWTEGTGTVTYNNGAGGAYDVAWSDAGNFVAGKGWKPGSESRVVGYSGTWDAAAVNSYVSLYGWTTEPLVEYYVVESFGSYDPSSGATKIGSVDSDGGSYAVYKTRRTGAPSIIGTADFDQYWSVRQTHRLGGDITVQNHIDAWRAAGLELGTFDYQILAVEGYQSSGSAAITVS